MTDDYAGYKKVGRDYQHGVINHSKLEYVVGLTHTNSNENFRSLVKRRLVGQFHKVSAKYLDCYSDEFTYRFNGCDDDRLSQNSLRNLVNGKTLTFENLTKRAQ